MAAQQQSDAQIENSIEIDAPPQRVWEIVSDVRRAPEWSSQAVRVLTLGTPKLGTWSLNLNKSGKTVWPTTSKIVEFEPGRRIANRITENYTLWVFELEPTATGTRLVQRRETPKGTSALSGVLVDRFFGGQERFTSSLTSGVSTALERIKRLAEHG